LAANPNEPCAAVHLKDSFLQVDRELAQKKGLHSGCTAVVAFTRMETRIDEKTKESVLKVGSY
jgi:hypothetical protein